MRSVQLLLTTFIVLLYGHTCLRRHPFDNRLNNALEVWCSIATALTCIASVSMGFASDLADSPDIEELLEDFLDDKEVLVENDYRVQTVLMVQILSMAMILLLTILLLFNGFPQVNKKLPGPLKQNLDKEKVAKELLCG